METQIKHLESSNLIVNGFTLTATGLVPNGEPSYEDWYACGEWLKRAEKAVGFWIGDWLNYGERKWGEMYSQAMEDTGLEYDTLRKFRNITKNLDFGIRMPNLSFKVNSAVARDDLTRDEKRMFLESAAEKDLTYDELKKEIKVHLKRKRLEKLPAPPQYVGAFELDSIQVADIHELDLPHASVDLIFTDPPYHDEYLSLYGALAELGAHVLKSGAYLMCYVGKMFMPTIINTMEANGLEYVWTFAVFQPFSKMKINKHRLFENWRPILVFKKPGDSKVREWVQDVVRGTRDKDFHDWQQDEDAPRQYIPAYTFEGDIVLDPFVGGGTTIAVCKETARHFIGFDVDADAVKMSIARVNGTHT